MRLPPNPHPPTGDPASVRIFRAGKNFFWICLGRWITAQLATLAGIIISLNILWSFQEEVDMLAQELRDEPPAAELPEVIGDSQATRDDRPEWIRAAAPKVAPYAQWVFPLITVLEVLGIAGYIVQLIGTGVVVRLDYELRWYIVTDRSLRIRSGIWRVRESTMSFANLQQVELSQGPLQRLLGLADVRVSSAGGGGGGGEKAGQNHEDSLHTSRFHGVTNAPEIRDLILSRLRQFREAGLGDPDDPASDHEHAEIESTRTGDSVAAAAELLNEVRALRRLAPVLRLPDR